MSDLLKIKQNIQKMANMGATEAEIDEYASIEGVTPNMIRNIKTPSNIVTSIPSNTELRRPVKPFKPSELKPMTIAEQAKAQNIGAISRISGQRISEVAKQYEGKTPESGLKRTFPIGMYRDPTSKQLAETILYPVMQGGIITGMATAPVATLKGLAVGLPVFKGLDLLSQKGVELLPQETPSEIKELAEALGYAGSFVVGGKILQKFQGINLPQKTQIGKLNEALKNIVKQGITKGIRPSVSGKSTFNLGKQYFDKAKSGVVEILNNKENLGFVDESGRPVIKTPETLTEYAQAIEATKSKIFSKYSALAKNAGDKGANFDAVPIIKKLIKVSRDINYNPQIREYAAKIINEIKELHGADPLIIQSRIKDLNRTLNGYYAGRVDKAKAELDASVANLMRSQLDNSIEKMTGGRYQDLKNAYGALKSVEKDVNHQAIVSMRAAPKNVFDLVDVFSGGKIVLGILQGNPAEIAAGITQTGMKNIFKRLNSPDRAVKIMFKNADNILNKIRRLSIQGQENIPVLTPEVVTQMPVSSQAGIPFAGTRQLPYYPPRGLPAPKTTYGQGFTMRKPVFKDYIRKKQKSAYDLAMEEKAKQILQQLWQDKFRR